MVPKYGFSVRGWAALGTLKKRALSNSLAISWQNSAFPQPRTPEACSPRLK